MVDESSLQTHNTSSKYKTRVQQQETTTGDPGENMNQAFFVSNLHRANMCQVFLHKEV